LLVTSFSAATISIAASKWSKRVRLSARHRGVHPAAGTRNALLSLGERRYLEVIAPDPAQSEIVHYPQLRSMTDPRLIGWAGPSAGHRRRRQAAPQKQSRIQRPDDGSERPDGRVLNWKTINLADDATASFLLHRNGARFGPPSKDAPAKCTLDYFEVMSADPGGTRRSPETHRLDLPVQRSDKARLHALISGPKGDVKLST